MKNDTRTSINTAGEREAVPGSGQTPRARGRVVPLPKVTRQEVKLVADHERVIARLFITADRERTKETIDRVLSLPDAQVTRLLQGLREDFAPRHRNINAIFEDHFRQLVQFTGEVKAMSPDRRLLVGAYFTCEYSVEAAALFNPSMVVHPDQTELGANECRFVMSLRACGEGHISSVEFRTGLIDGTGRVSFDTCSKYAITEQPVADRQYLKYPFYLKLNEMGAYNEIAQHIVDDLEDSFTLDDLCRVVEAHREEHSDRQYVAETSENILWLARSNYHIEFPPGTDLSERVIFPVSENESRGIEDARFVRFVHDNGRVVYYATYTAYNGFRILPQLIETSDFRYFKIITLNGRYAENKGMALFPRRIDDKYVMISRVDGKNLYLMLSDNLHFWNEAAVLRQPTYPWELVQIGNCGSPLETERGWLVLTHGVGPMRRYSIGAMLLDLEDPSKVIGCTKTPILMPNAAERDGYVPNVVYSCGGMIHKGELIIPYAMSDSATSVATVPVAELLDHMTQ